MAPNPRLVKRVGELEIRMDSLERSHRDIIEQVKPLREVVATMNFVQKGAAFLTVICSLAVAAAHWFHR